ncbi:kinesin [Strigomonas culicis]|uniref:Kinesin n=1 Tax=Strigomonas culicis TaxID=28005 RepID=S9U6X8_9TRYP|nr:kinesin [Strigomonas culicis]EPY25610.1 kinesin [Strigomonas culicis]|eukprot:EPY24638.1 kinesin [Strigomonas culicis]
MLLTHRWSSLCFYFCLSSDNPSAFFSFFPLFEVFRSLSEMTDEKSRVQVSIRIRPLLKIDKNDKPIVHPLDETSLSLSDDKKAPKSYQFDHVLCGDQQSVYETIGRPMLEEAYKGFNVCLFAYGQTGSGKTYSLLGDISDEEKQGVAPRFVQELFDEAQRRVDEDTDLTIKVSLSMIEVYMEKVRDLLAPRQRGQEPEALEIHEDSNRRVYVKDASVHQVLGSERTMQLLRKGNANRQTAETKMNETSSRSHAIVQIAVTQEFATLEKKDLECTISLVDLAGSERQTKTESSGQHFEEAKKINHSLLMLGRALNSFSERKGNADSFISLRESKLTRLLSESFGGNSKTWMLATVSPTAYNAYETISTLDYASNAKAITNKARINKSVRDLEYKDLVRLRAHLETCLARENTLVVDNTQRCEVLSKELDQLLGELEVCRSDFTIENELENALVEREMLLMELRTALENSVVGNEDEPLICFSGMIKVAVGSVPMDTIVPITAVVPVFDFVGPPPLLRCTIRVTEPVADCLAVVVEVLELFHLPDFCSGGARVSLWFEGQESSRVYSHFVAPNAGNPQFSLSQSFLFDSAGEKVRNFLSKETLMVCVEGALGIV